MYIPRFLSNLFHRKAEPAAPALSPDTPVHIMLCDMKAITNRVFFTITTPTLKETLKLWHETACMVETTPFADNVLPEYKNIAKTLRSVAGRMEFSRLRKAGIDPMNVANDVEIEIPAKDYMVLKWALPFLQESSERYGLLFSITGSKAYHRAYSQVGNFKAGVAELCRTLDRRLCAEAAQPAPLKETLGVDINLHAHGIRNFKFF